MKEYGQCNVSTPAVSTESDVLTLSTYSGDLAGYAQVPFAEPSASSSFSENGYTYQPGYAIDQKVERPWVEGVKGDGIGEYLLLSFDRPERIDLLSIHPGFPTSYEKNNRPQKVEISFSDGRSIDYELEDLNEDIYILFSQPVLTEYLKITILSVYHGQIPDTCIAEICAFTSRNN